jgi:hypothetical protein
MKRIIKINIDFFLKRFNKLYIKIVKINVIKKINNKKLS